MIQPRSPRLPAPVAARLLAEAPAISRRMARRIAQEVGPLGEEYRNPRYLRTVAAACRDSVVTLVRLLDDGLGLRQGDLDQLGQMGARQADAGVPLETLLAGYRLAAKVVWEEVEVAVGSQAQDLSPGAIFAIADAVLGYLDDISGAVSSAYMSTRARLVHERARDRDRVLLRLLAGDASIDLLRLATSLDLDLRPPYRVVACRVDPGDGEVAPPAAPPGGHVVTDVTTSGWIALVPPGIEPEGLWRQWSEERRARALPASLTMGIGPVAANLEDVGPAADRARQALLVGSRIRPDRPVHLDAEVGIYASMAANRPALEAYVHHVLGPLAAPSTERMVELRETLEALLVERTTADAAARLGIHRHTVVYRLRRLQMLGIDPEPPRTRPRLWLALIGRRLLNPPS